MYFERGSGDGLIGKFDANVVVTDFGGDILDST